MADRKNLKRKVTIDLSEESVNAIEQFRKEESLEGLYANKSMTELINNCITLCIGSSHSYRETLAKLAFDKIKKYDPQNVAGYKNEKDIATFRKLYDFLTYDRGLYNGNKNLTRYDFSDGYVIVPDDWIFLNPEKVSEAEYCFPLIIEVRNGEKYRIPHFFFLSSSEKLADEDKEKYLNIAFTKCDALNAVKNLIAYPIVSKEGENLNHEICLAAPEPKFFSFPKFGDRYSSSVFGELWVTKGRIELMKKYGESK